MHATSDPVTTHYFFFFFFSRRLQSLERTVAHPRIQPAAVRTNVLKLTARFAGTIVHTPDSLSQLDKLYTCGPFATPRTVTVVLNLSPRAACFELSHRFASPLFSPFFFFSFSFPSGNRNAECVAIDSGSSANVIDHRVPTSAARARTRILSTVDRVIARISTLDCDGRD